MNKKVSLWERYLTREIGIEFKSCLYFFAILFYYCLYRVVHGVYTADILHMTEMILLCYVIGYAQVYLFHNFDEAWKYEPREIIGFILVFNELGINSFEYYTEDSNLLLLISSSIFLICLFANKELPSWFKSLRFAAIVSTTLTLIIVLTVLSWTTDLGLHHLLFNGSMLYHHTLCPVLAILSFVFIEKYDNL